MESDPAVPAELVAGRLRVPARARLPAEKLPAPSRETTMFGVLELVETEAIVRVFPEGVIVTLLPGLTVTASCKPFTPLTTCPAATAPAVTALARQLVGGYAPGRDAEGDAAGAASREACPRRDVGHDACRRSSR